MRFLFRIYDIKQQNTHIFQRSTTIRGRFQTLTFGNVYTYYLGVFLDANERQPRGFNEHECFGMIRGVQLDQPLIPIFLSICQQINNEHIHYPSINQVWFYPLTYVPYRLLLTLHIVKFHNCAKFVILPFIVSAFLCFFGYNTLRNPSSPTSKAGTPPIVSKTSAFSSAGLESFEAFFSLNPSAVSKCLKRTISASYVSASDTIPTNNGFQTYRLHQLH